MERRFIHKGMRVRTTYSEIENIEGIVLSVGYNWVVIEEPGKKPRQHPNVCIVEVKE